MRPAQSRNRALVDSLMSVQRKEAEIRSIFFRSEFSTLNKCAKKSQNGFCKRFRRLRIEVAS